jgi:alkylhydroperoxidase/carboxymuconolactone decarboxylase family protein YurZ
MASTHYERGVEVLRAIGSYATEPPPGHERWPALPPDQADDLGRKLTEFCFGDTWGREGSHLDLKTRRLLTIAALVAMGRERQLRGHVGGALTQGITPEEITEAIVHLVAYCGFPAGLTAIEIANEVFKQRGVAGAAGSA